MTYDLVVFPVDRALTFAEASAAIDALVDTRAPGTTRDTRLDPFIATMRRRYWRLRVIGLLSPPFEFDVLAGHVLIGIPWSRVAEVASAVGDAAYHSGLAVLDPQRTAVGLPAPYADAPMTVEGIEPHVASGGDALAAVRPGASLASSGSEDVHGDTSSQPSGTGVHTTGPLDPEATREGDEGTGDGAGETGDGAGEAAADPRRVPSSLQTAEHRAELIAALVLTKVGERHSALGELAGWNPDPVVAAALRPILASDDVFAASEAATGLARQADITDLPGVLSLVYRLSPADGGTTEAMLIPLRAALSLAELGGPVAVDGVKDRARTWRGARKVRHQSWEQVFDQELDELLGDG